ncbi:hemolysin XhlA family protein [Cytobacillus firmus]|uniref:hemolysin XhlA family protein n=1 Tax=Cytobacillus firmus TaxID=1399 RepID=UPI0018CEBE99|nr:hemolysin XhlA family protein [Cytobacillus firmus]MBG9603531.1 phage-like protein [Cytobacillus firmus]MBG9655043.1 phage-like protein [Cytobacillus firmus]MED1908874.1 hemolysin XhlA family protein [Cytobacillus firmus]
MTQEAEAVDIWKQTIQRDIEELKKSDEKQQEEISKLKQITDFHERDIKDIKETLREIKDDTKWLRRSITNALIVALIGGAVAIFYAAIKIGGV